MLYLKENERMMMAKTKKEVITIETGLPKMARVEIMHSRLHGVKSNKTKRRQEKMRARTRGWD
jgi:hypothetical protein